MNPNQRTQGKVIKYKATFIDIDFKFCLTNTSKNDSSLINVVGKIDFTGDFILLIYVLAISCTDINGSNIKTQRV